MPLDPLPPLDTYPFADVTRVPSPNPPGFYDPDDYHRLQDHQIESMLQRRPDPARFSRYTFAPQQFTDFYQSIASEYVQLCNKHPTPNDDERADRINFFKFMTRRYHSIDRVVRA